MCARMGLGGGCSEQQQTVITGGEIPCGEGKAGLLKMELDKNFIVSQLGMLLNQKNTEHNSSKNQEFAFVKKYIK